MKPPARLRLGPLTDEQQNQRYCGAAVSTRAMSLSASASVQGASDVPSGGRNGPMSILYFRRMARRMKLVYKLAPSTRAIACCEILPSTTAQVIEWQPRRGASFAAFVPRRY